MVFLLRTSDLSNTYNKRYLLVLKKLTMKKKQIGVTMQGLYVKLAMQDKRDEPELQGSHSAL